MCGKHHALKVPCKSCPYRKDVPSGVWEGNEYKKLPAYDGEIGEQLVNGGTGLFLCHQQNNALCSGWLGCHGTDNLLALRLHGGYVQPEVWGYKTTTQLFSSGAEAAAHGLRDINQPTDDATKVINRLLKKKGE
jgi:hypothetical protein